MSLGCMIVYVGIMGLMKGYKNDCVWKLGKSLIRLNIHYSGMINHLIGWWYEKEQECSSDD